MSAEQERTQSIVDNTNDIIVILDASGIITFENAAVEHVLGFVPGERVGHSILEYSHPDDVPAAATRFGELVGNPEARTTMNMRFRHKDGSWRHLETSGRNMFHVPAIRGILGVGRDVTERLRLQERLQASERLDSIGRLAGGVAHDFNNLLTVILSAAEQLSLCVPAGAAGNEEIADITAAAERASELTAKLLLFARQPAAESGSVDATLAIRKAEGLLRRLMGEECALVADPGHVSLPIAIGPVEFDQVLFNLAANARDAMPEGGRFTMTCRASSAELARAHGAAVLSEGTVAQITFADTGVGMSADVAAKVFDPFYTTKPAGSGTGLGLSMVYGVVRSAGGDVRVVSTAGGGTSIEIFVPVIDRVSVPAPTPRVDPPIGGRETVLLVEDNEAVRRLTTRSLEMAGYRVVPARSGAAARGVVGTGLHIDLLATDVVMSEMNGVRLAQALRQVCPELPVLFITGYAKEETFGCHELDGQTAVLLKPFRRETLLTRVRQLLDGTAPAVDMTA